MKLTTVLVASTLCCGPAFGQSIGANLAGVVTDETGARLQDATVTITHILNGRAVTLNTGPRASTARSRCCPASTRSWRHGVASRPSARRVVLPVGADATLNFTLPRRGRR